MADFIKKMEDDILEKEIEHDKKVIAREEKREAVHEAQFKKDNTELYQDIREDEMKHDQKVIDRKEEDLKKHEEKLEKNEAEMKK